MTHHPHPLWDALRSQLGAIRWGVWQKLIFAFVVLMSLLNLLIGLVVLAR